LSSHLTARAPVTLYASVTDENGRVVTGLSAADFVFEVDGKTQAAAVSPDSGPGAIALLLDRSGSMTRVLDEIANISEGLIGNLPPGSRARIAQMVPGIQIHPPEPLPDRRAVADAIRALPVPNNTALWDTIDSAVNAVSGIGGYRSIVAITDGDDTGSRLRAPTVLEHAQRAGVPVHGVLLVGSLNGSGGPVPSGGQLKQFADDSGGIYWGVRSVKDPLAFGTQLANSLSSRYILTIDGPASSGPHSVRLRVTNSKYKVAIANRMFG
jgi:hypothetical protein